MKKKITLEKFLENVSFIYYRKYSRNFYSRIHFNPKHRSKNIILISTIIIFILSFILYEEKNITYIIKSILTITILIGIIIHGKTLFHKSNPDIILDTDSEYSRIWIRKINKSSKQIYTLEADKGYESISTNNRTLYSDYMKYYDLFDYYNSNTQNVLMIGGAAYVYQYIF